MTTQQQHNMEVSQTILAQLGGKRFIAMTGSKNFTAGDNTLTFKVGSNPKRITHTRITLTPADDYTVEFLKVRGVEIKSVANVNGLYHDQLQEVFTRHTGLYTSL